MTSYDTFLAGVLDRGGREARADGSATIEAHHVLLAVAAAGEPGTDEILAEILAGAGLTYRRLRDALDREFERSLAAAGVTLAALPVRSAPTGPPGIGASVKLALERGFGPVSRKRDLRPEHLLLGILRAPVGTVPRALALAGIDRADLIERTRRRLGADHD